MPEGRSLLYLVDTFAAVAWYRCHVPGHELKRNGYEVVLAGADDARLHGYVDAADVVVFERPFHPAIMQAFEHARRAGKRCVVDIDDDLWSLDPTNPAYRYWSRPDFIGALEWAMRAADLVTVSTPNLVGMAKRLNSEVRVLSNMLPAEFWPHTERPSPTDKVCIGWAGSASHFSDLRQLRGLVEGLLERRKNLTFRIAGIKQIPFKPHHRMVFERAVKIEEYPALLAKFDIGLAPLADTRFNRCKSDLKFLEYSAVGIPTVASAVDAYTGTIENGKSGLLAKSPKDWLRHIERLTEDPGFRADIGDRARRYAETRMIDRNIRNWIEAYGLGPIPLAAGA